MAELSTSLKHRAIRVAYYVGPRGKYQNWSVDSFKSMYGVWRDAPAWARFVIGEISELDHKFYVWDLDHTQVQAQGALAKIPIWKIFDNLDAAFAAASLKADSPDPNQLTQLMRSVNKVEWIVENEEND